MVNRFKKLISAISPKDECGPFHEALEAMRLPGIPGIDSTLVLMHLQKVDREHALQCETCRGSVDDFVTVRNLLLPLTMEIPASVPSPWFSTRVMNSISSQIAEGDGPEGVWLDVRKFAPRLAAFCAFLLVVAGTWAFQVQRQISTVRANKPAEGLFESGSYAPLNDDVMASVEDRR